MASADAIEREAERRRLAFLQYAASQGFSGTTPVSDIPIMTEAAGPIIPDEPDESNGGFWQSVGRNIVGAYNAADSLLGMIKPSSPDDVRNAVAAYENIYENPEDIVLEPLRSVNRVVDLAPYIDTGEEGIDYANAWRRGEGLTMGVNDALTLYALGRGAIKAPSVIRNNITNPGARFNPYDYGIHVNVPGNLPANTKRIIPRQVGEGTTVGGDSIPGNSYMWDATSPQVIEGILGNRQMTNTGMMDFLYDDSPAAFFTRARRSRTGTDINIPSSPSLAVTGSQKVIEGGIPLTTEALQDLFARRRVMEMGDDAAFQKIIEYSGRPGVPDAIGNGNATFAYNYIRDKIVRAQGNPNDPLSGFSPSMTLEDMLNDPVLYPQVEAFAASRIAGQRLNPPDPIRDQILQVLNEQEYIAALKEAQALSKQGIPFTTAFQDTVTKTITEKLTRISEQQGGY